MFIDDCIAHCNDFLFIYCRCFEKNILFKIHTVFNKTQMTQQTLDFYGEERGKGTVAKVRFVAIFPRSKFNFNF